MKQSYVWSGVYKKIENLSHDDIPAFMSERWISQISNQLNEYKKSNLCPPPRVSDLPIIASILEAYSILDFGGSSGWLYEYIKKACPEYAKKISKYTIYELPDICKYFSKNSSNPESVKYISKAIEISHHDIFYSNSMIQYILNDDELMSCFHNTSPSHIILENFIGGEFDSFYTKQIYYEYKIPVKFRNDNKFITLVEKLGYKLIVNKIYLEPIRGVIKKFDMENFPENLRVDYGKTLIFRKI